MSSVDSGPDLVELKNMVMSFRVSELQVLLGCAGRNKSGRKHDLLSRALQLLKTECSSHIKSKVKELYLRRFPRSRPIQPTAFMPNDKRSLLDYDHRKDKKKASGAMGYAVHPDVRFKKIPFYDIISDVLKPSSLITRPHRESSRCDFSFTLSEEQVRLIKESRAKDPIKRYQVQVQLRFCLLETTCHQKDFLPPNLVVHVNHQVASLPPYIPPSKAGVEPKRSNRPIDITMYCRICDVSYNKLEVCWIAEHGKNFAVCIDLVQPLSSETLLQRLKRKGIRNADHSKALIKEKLARDPDSEIATTSLKVSLLCPLGTMRMTLPIRPITCTHMQCFDAMLFLQMNEKKPTWVCPVCDKPAEFSDLFIDGLFLEILEATREKEIIFLDDGKWQPVQPKAECLSLCTPSKSSNTIALDLSSSPNSSPSVNGGSDSKRKEPIVIDLTCDSDDESEKVPSPPKRKDIDREQDEVHSLSSTSPYRSDTASVHRDDGPPPSKHRRTPDLTWEPNREGPPSASKLYNNPVSSSPMPSGFGHTEDRPAPARLHTPGFPIPGSRDNTPPLYPMGSLLNPGYPSYLEYSTAVDFNFPYLLNQSDALRRLNGDRSARSSPYLINPSSSSLLFPPSSRSSSSEHISRNYLSNPYHPYSPLPAFLQPQDSDVIPID